MYEDLQFLDVEIDDSGIALVTLNKPEQLNACGWDDHGELVRILELLQIDDRVKVAIVTGAGKAFSVGGQLELLELLNAEPERLYDMMKDARALVDGHIALEKPILAAINGVAMGSGAAFALLCDFIVMERQARVSDGHIRAAIAAGDGGAVIWPLSVGLVQTKKYLMTGDWISAEEAERIGLVSEISEQGESLTRTREIAERLVRGPETAIRLTKAALNQWLHLGKTVAFDYSVALEMLSFLSADVTQAVEGLRERREGAIPPDKRISPS